MALGTEGYAVVGCEEDVTCVIARIDGSVVAVGDTNGGMEQCCSIE
jgi:hypothetical protein